MNSNGSLCSNEKKKPDNRALKSDFDFSSRTSKFKFSIKAQKQKLEINKYKADILYTASIFKDVKKYISMLYIITCRTDYSHTPYKYKTSYARVKQIKDTFKVPISIDKKETLKKNFTIF